MDTRACTPKHLFIYSLKICLEIPEKERKAQRKKNEAKID